eukprot:jgi/Galph1/3121/GphlegSOOS_G1761.1
MPQDTTENQRNVVNAVLERHSLSSLNWQPDVTGLNIIITMLRQSLSGSSEAQEAVYKSLKELSEHPDFTKYLAYFFSNGSNPEVVNLATNLHNFPTLSEGELVAIRQQAAILLKNHITYSWERKIISQEDLNYIKKQIVLCLGEENHSLRYIAAVCIASFVKDAFGSFSSLSQLLDIFLDMLNHDLPLVQEGVLIAFSIICEDHADKLCSLANDPLSVYIPKLIYFFRHPNAQFRYYAVQSTSQFICLRPKALVENMELYIDALFSVAQDESPAVRKRFCSSICTLLETSQDALLPQMDAIIEYMLSASQDSATTVALEACEFWCTYTEMTGAKPILRKFLSRLVPILLDNLVYSEEEIATLSADEGVETMPDREQDIRPFLHYSKSKGIRHGYDASQGINGEVFSAQQKDSNPAPQEEEDSDYSDEEEDDDVDLSEWNVRKCSASSLDTLSHVFQDELLTYLLPHLQPKLLSDAWQIRESGILALGAVAEGCLNGLKPHLPALVPFLLNLLSDSHPLVRVMSCWTLSRYAHWILEENVQKNSYFQPLLERLLENVLSRNKSVQAAACSSLATIEEEAGLEIIPYLEPVLKSLAFAFPKYQEKNLRLLYDVIGTLAQTVGNEFKKKEYIEIIMPPLISRWNSLSDDDKHLLPLLECLSAVFVSLGEEGSPFAKPVFQRCMKIIHMTMMKTVEDQRENAFIYFSLDLVSALVESLASSFEPLARECNLLEILYHCLKDSDPEIRQSAFAVVGELSKSCPSLISPYGNQILGIIVDNITLEHVSISNNAIWSLGEICMNVRLDLSVVQSSVERVVPVLIRLINRPHVSLNLLENCAVTLGRLGMVVPQLLASSLEQFSYPTCIALVKLPDEKEKEQALKGLCALTRMNPSGMVRSFIPFCDMIASWSRQNSDLEREFMEILQLFKSSSDSNWETFLNSFPTQLRNVLHHRFGL